MTRRPSRRVVALVLAATTALTACGDAESAAPRCDGTQRLGLVAQSVPSAAFVPCISTLPAGWRVTSFDVWDGGTELSLRSDRAERDVDIRLSRSCGLRRATPVTPRDDGVRTYVRLDAISPRYAGTMLDVFPGGCVAYDFDFERGPHIALTEELHSAVALYSRRELRRELRDDPGIDLDG